jgi:hypothetical protein
MTARQVANHFSRANLDDINDMPSALATLGHVHETAKDTYATLDG